MGKNEIECKKSKTECKTVKLKMIDSCYLELGQTKFKWRTKIKRRWKGCYQEPSVINGLLVLLTESNVVTRNQITGKNLT